MANHLRTRAFGFDPVKRLAAALRTLVGSVREQGCNCLQIDAVATRSFLGHSLYHRFGASPARTEGNCVRRAVAASLRRNTVIFRACSTIRVVA